MSTPADPSSQIVSRLSQLERQHRQFRRLAVGGLCLLPLGLAAFATARSAPVVQANRVELVAASGARQAVLSADAAGVSLTLLDRKGRPGSSMRLSNDSTLTSDNPTLTLRDAEGRAVATLGGPTLRHLIQ